MNTIRKKILIVDDEPDILDMLSLILGREGYEIVLADCGSMALEKIYETNFDIVVCDFLMPKMDGISLLKKVREQSNITPFIFFSGNADNHHETQMVGLGAYQLVSKADVIKLPSIIKKTLAHGEDVNKLNEDKTLENVEFIKILHSSR